VNRRYKAEKVHSDLREHLQTKIDETGQPFIKHDEMAELSKKVNWQKDRDLQDFIMKEACQMIRAAARLRQHNVPVDFAGRIILSS
jgi:hypothetical protein